MNYEVELTDSFKRTFKRLNKKYHSLNDDLELLIKDLENNPDIGTNLGNGIRKIRMAISDKAKGKSHGARIITHTAIINIENGLITLLAIYDKNDQDTITKKEITHLLSEL